MLLRKSCFFVLLKYDRPKPHQIVIEVVLHYLQVPTPIYLTLRKLSQNQDLKPNKYRLSKFYGFFKNIFWVWQPCISAMRHMQHDSGGKIIITTVMLCWWGRFILKVTVSLQCKKVCLSALPARNDLTMRPVRLWATVTSTTTRAIDEVWVVRVLSMFRKVTNWSYFAHTTTAVKFRHKVLITLLNTKVWKTRSTIYLFLRSDAVPLVLIYSTTYVGWGYRQKVIDLNTTGGR